MTEPGRSPGDGQAIATRSEEFRQLFERIKVATRLSSELNARGLDDAEAIREAFEELIGKPVGDRFHLIPPFYADYGLNITVGRAVFIGPQCAFTGHAAIDIADEVMIAHKVNLVTAGHPLEPGKRRSAITAAPITIGTNVWVGAAATVLPGVTIGAGAVVAAGAVVTRDVPPTTLVAGVPARVVSSSSGRPHHLLAGPPSQRRRPRAMTRAFIRNRSSITSLRTAAMSSSKHSSVIAPLATRRVLASSS